MTLLNPHDALKHHFTSLKTDLIFLQQRVLERNDRPKMGPLSVSPMGGLILVSTVFHNHYQGFYYQNR